MLDLFPIGNCTASALIDREGRYVWACVPRLDGDPFFSALLGGRDPALPEAQGLWDVVVENAVRTDQAYLRNTPVLRTVITTEAGPDVEIIDFCPRYRQYGRTYRPLAFIRLIKPLGGTPRVTIRMRPTEDYGARPCPQTVGSNHIRYV